MEIICKQQQLLVASFLFPDGLRLCAVPAAFGHFDKASFQILLCCCAVHLGYCNRYRMRCLTARLTLKLSVLLTADSDSLVQSPHLPRHLTVVKRERYSKTARESLCKRRRAAGRRGIACSRQFRKTGENDPSAANPARLEGMIFHDLLVPKPTRS